MERPRCRSDRTWKRVQEEKVNSLRYSRRRFLGSIGAVAGLVGASALLQACNQATPTPAPASKPPEQKPAEQKPAGQPTQAPAKAAEAKPTTAPAPAQKPAAGKTAFSGQLQMWVQTYTPTDSLTPSPQNPVPKQAVRKIADEYQKMYPDVKIEFVKNPANVNARVWTETMQAGGTAPHTMWQHSFQIDDDVKKGWWIPLDPYMEQPNPYVKDGPGSQRWIDQFYEIPTSTKKSIDGKLYVVPYDLVTTYFYYNKDHFTKAGVEAPKTWAEFMTVLQKLKDAKFTPLMRPGWSDTQVAQMVFGSLEEKIHPGGGPVSRKEVECAIVNKVWDFETPMGYDYLKILKDITPYYTPDWAAAGVDFARKFSTGEVTIFEDGTWRFGNLKFDTLIKFQWGTFYCPTVTKETTPHATGKAAPPIGGATAAQWAITSRAQKENKIDLAVDVLRWFSVPENAGAFIGEAGQFLPNVKGVKVNPELEEPLKAITTGYGEAAMFVYGDKVSQETGQKRNDVVTNLRLGKLTVEQAQKEYQKVHMEGAKDDIAKNNWTC